MWGRGLSASHPGALRYGQMMKARAESNPETADAGAKACVHAVFDALKPRNGS